MTEMLKYLLFGSCGCSFVHLGRLSIAPRYMCCYSLEYCSLAIQMPDEKLPKEIISCILCHPSLIICHFANFNIRRQCAKFAFGNCSKILAASSTSCNSFIEIKSFPCNFYIIFGAKHSLDIAKNHLYVFCVGSFKNIHYKQYVQYRGEGCLLISV